MREENQNIVAKLNSVDLIKYALYQGYQIPDELSFLNLTQERILMTVKKSNNVSMVSIARSIGLEKGAFSQIVDKLETLDLLKRIRSVEDRRTIHLKLTDKGEILTDQVQNSMESHFNEITKNLNKGEIDLFFNALEILKATANKLIIK